MSNRPTTTAAQVARQRDDKLLNAWAMQDYRDRKFFEELEEREAKLDARSPRTFQDSDFSDDEENWDVDPELEKLSTAIYRETVSNLKTASYYERRTLMQHIEQMKQDKLLNRSQAKEFRHELDNALAVMENRAASSGRGRKKTYAMPGSGLSAAVKEQIRMRDPDRVAAECEELRLRTEHSKRMLTLADLRKGLIIKLAALVRSFRVLTSLAASKAKKKQAEEGKPEAPTLQKRPTLAPRVAATTSAHTSKSTGDAAESVSRPAPAIKRVPTGFVGSRTSTTLTKAGSSLLLGSSNNVSPRQPTITGTSLLGALPTATATVTTTTGHGSPQVKPALSRSVRTPHALSSSPVTSSLETPPRHLSRASSVSTRKLTPSYPHTPQKTAQLHSSTSPGNSHSEIVSEATESLLIDKITEEDESSDTEEALKHMSIRGTNIDPVEVELFRYASREGWTDDSGSENGLVDFGSLSVNYTTAPFEVLEIRKPKQESDDDYDSNADSDDDEDDVDNDNDDGDEEGKNNRKDTERGEQEGGSNSSTKQGAPNGTGTPTSSQPGTPRRGSSSSTTGSRRSFAGESLGQPSTPRNRRSVNAAESDGPPSHGSEHASVSGDGNDKPRKSVVRKAKSKLTKDNSEIMILHKAGEDPHQGAWKLPKGELAEEARAERRKQEALQESQLQQAIASLQLRIDTMNKKRLALVAQYPDLNSTLVRHDEEIEAEMRAYQQKIAERNAAFSKDNSVGTEKRDDQAQTEPSSSSSSSPQHKGDRIGSGAWQLASLPSLPLPRLDSLTSVYSSNAVSTRSAPSARRGGK